MPRRALRGSLEKHVLRGLHVLFPMPPVAPVLVADLPVLVRIGLTRLESRELLVLRDEEEKLDDDRAVIEQMPLELVDLAIRALPLRRRAESLDALDEHA